MVAPITGPHVEFQSRNIDGVGSLYYLKNRYRQKKPYSLPLTYKFLKRSTLRAEYHGGITGYAGFANANTDKSPWWMYAYFFTFQDTNVVDALNKARAKLVDQLSVTVEGAVTLAERKQAMSMMTSRIMQIYKFARKLRKFDFVGAAKELGVVKDPRFKQLQRGDRLRTRARDFAGNYLEFHFGWSPLISDIYGAIDLLSSDVPMLPVKDRARINIDWRPYWDTGCGGSYYRANHVGYVSVNIGCGVRVTNANLFLASRMGLTNPATVAWELVPFSFVVDWFVNVGEYLNQFTELNGIDIIDPYHTLKAKLTTTAKFWSNNCSTGVHFGGYDVVSESLSVERKLGFPSVTLKKRPPWRLSPRRAAAAISLLIQQGIRV